MANLKHYGGYRIAAFSFTSRLRRYNFHVPTFVYPSSLAQELMLQFNQVESCRRTVLDENARRFAGHLAFALHHHPVRIEVTISQGTHL